MTTLAEQQDVQQIARELEDAAEKLEKAPPQDILAWAIDRFNPGVSLACSFGLQSVACIDMLAKSDLLRAVEVFYLDTGVLFPQTHQTRLRIQAKYHFRAIRVAAELSWEEQEAKFGGLLYERGKEGINQCCEIRKNEPSRKYLATRTAWITGVRRSHTKTRADVPVVHWDYKHNLVKINPVAAFDDATMWAYIKANDVPYNPLYDQGYPSIGCNTPVCTRPVKPGEDPRSGRWGGMKAECGIHMDGRVIKSLDASQL
jgi:phosphoadenosine phosphosulfate reductase